MENIKLKESVNMSIPIPNCIKQVSESQLIIGVLTGVIVGACVAFFGPFGVILVTDSIEDRAKLTHEDFEIIRLQYGEYDKNTSLYDNVTIRTRVNITNKEDARYIAETTTAVYWITMTNGENTHPRSFYSGKSKIPIPPSVTFTRTDDIIVTYMKNGEYILNCVIEYEDAKGALIPLKMSRKFTIS